MTNDAGARAADPDARTVAERYLSRLQASGIETLFVNAGTDFAPLIEAYARQKAIGGASYPTPVVCGHENLAAGMAHGAYLVTGRLQAVMFHVSVGTANAICAVANAARDHVPLLVTAGRSPILEDGARGARDASIHWAQEMFDQAGMVRELVKWDYELRDPRQLDQVVDRALTVAVADPRGPVYLSLPREVLAADAVDAPVTAGTAAPARAHPDPETVAALAERLVTARFPVIVATASGVDRSTVDRLGGLCVRHHIGVAQVAPRCVNIPHDHPLYVGPATQRLFDAADVLVFLESDVPWMAAASAPSATTFVAQTGVDPLFSRYPMRTHRSDLTIAAPPAALLMALDHALDERAAGIDPERRGRIDAAARDWREALAKTRRREADHTGPITKTFLSVTLAEVIDQDAVVFNEYWADPDLLDRRHPGTYFSLPPAGGLGWALPAALGAKLTAPDRTVIATVGDGAYLFANPAACHHASAKHNLPILTVVANNRTWGAVDWAARSVYPHGAAAEQDGSPLSDLSPSPAFEAYCEASGGLGERVTSRAQLRSALERALHAARDQGRQALLNVECA